MDQNTFDGIIDNFQRFAKEIFSPAGENKFKVKLMEALEEILKIGKYHKCRAIGFLISQTHHTMLQKLSKCDFKA